jgi:hypothetical protein
LPATARASFGCYNNTQDVERLVAGCAQSARAVRLMREVWQRMDLKELYREVILDHNRSPRNFGRLDPADATAAGRNPLCGDVLDITLRMQGDRLTDLRFEGQGCAISMASASLMSEAVKGRRRDEIERSTATCTRC